jgi:hypothetical protein
MPGLGKAAIETIREEDASALTMNILHAHDIVEDGELEDSARSEYGDTFMLNRHHSQIGDLPSHIVRTADHRVQHHQTRNKRKMRQHLARELEKVLVQEKKLQLDKNVLIRSASIEIKMEKRRAEISAKVASTQRKILKSNQMTEAKQKAKRLEFHRLEQTRQERKRKLEGDFWDEVTRKRQVADTKRQANYARMKGQETEKKKAVLGRIRHVDDRLAERKREADLTFHVKKFLSSVAQEEAAGRRAMKDQRSKNKADKVLDSIQQREMRKAEQQRREGQVAMKTMKLARPEFELHTPLQRLVNYIKQRGTANVEPHKLRAKARALGIDADINVVEVLEQMRDHTKF